MDGYDRGFNPVLAEHAYDAQGVVVLYAEHYAGVWFAKSFDAARKLALQIVAVLVSHL